MKKLNSGCGPVIRKNLHVGLSCGSMNVVEADAWSNKKSMIQPKRSDFNPDAFIIIGETFLTRDLLETEWRFFGNTE